MKQRILLEESIKSRFEMIIRCEGSSFHHKLSIDLVLMNFNLFIFPINNRFFGDVMNGKKNKE
jgi:hypothetical protein